MAKRDMGGSDFGLESKQDIKVKQNVSAMANNEINSRK